MRISNVNTIKYYTIWALMLKIKLKHTNLLDFVSSSLFCLENDKLSWNSYWHKNSSYKCIHISALQSRKLRLRESTRLMLSSALVFGVREFKRPPLTAFKNIIIQDCQHLLVKKFKVISRFLAYFGPFFKVLLLFFKVPQSGKFPIGSYSKVKNHSKSCFRMVFDMSLRWSKAWTVIY